MIEQKEAEKIVFIGKGVWEKFLNIFNIKTINICDIENEKPHIIFTNESVKKEVQEYLRKAKIDKQIIVYSFKEEEHEIKEDEDIHDLISKALGIKV